MRINWPVTTALATILACGTAFAQSPSGERHGNDASRAPQRAAQPLHQGAGDQAGQEVRDHAAPATSPRAEGELKEKAHEPQAAAQQAPTPDRHAQERSAHDATPTKQAETPRSDSDATGGKQHAAAPRNARDEHSRRGNQAKAHEPQRSHDQAQGAVRNDRKGRNGATAQNKPGSDATRDARQNDRSQPPSSPSAAANDKANDKANASSSTSTAQSQHDAAQPGNRASAKLSETDRSKVISTLEKQRGASRDQVNVRVNIGERLPPRIHPRPLPRTVVEVMPEYRGYDFVTVRDEVYIVRPGTREVVDVIDERGGSSYARSETRETRIHLSTDQRQMLLREARPMTTSQVSSAGSTCFSLQPVPESLASQNPDLRGFQYIRIGDDVVLVDPKDQKVVDVVNQ
jgi:hypothetical protein